MINNSDLIEEGELAGQHLLFDVDHAEYAGKKGKGIGCAEVLSEEEGLYG